MCVFVNMLTNRRKYSSIGLFLDAFCRNTKIIVIIAIAYSAVLSTKLVTCRSYNNGLVFYNLQTHGTYLPPTVSVSRGRSLANFKYSDKGSIWSTFGQPCECVNQVCGCCAGLQVEQYKFDQKICANVTFVPDAEEAQLEVYLNEKSSAKYGLSARNPSPFCIPVMMGVPMGMCVQMSNIQMVGNNLNMCMDFVVRLASTDLFEMHFQCMRMGLDGLQYLDKNGQPVLPQSSHDDDYDFFDDNPSNPLDSESSNADDEASAAEYYEELEKQQKQQKQQQQQQDEILKLDIKDDKQSQELKDKAEQMLQLQSPLSEDIVSQSNSAIKNSIELKNESEMINTTVNANNVNDNNMVVNDDDNDDVENKVVVAINAPSNVMANNEEGDSKSYDNDIANTDDDQSNNGKLFTTMTIKTPTTTTTTTTIDRVNEPIIDDEEIDDNYMATDKIQLSAAAEAEVVTTAGLERDRESMAQYEEKKKENVNSIDDVNKKSTTIPPTSSSSTSSTATALLDENSSNKVNPDDEDNYEMEEVNDREEEEDQDYEEEEEDDVNDAEDDEEDEEAEEEEHQNNDINTMISNESITNNDKQILNDANIATERVNVTANEHKIDFDDRNNDLDNENNNNNNDVDDDDNVNEDISDNDVDNTEDDDEADDFADDDDSYKNHLNAIENTFTLPELRSVNSNKFYRHLHRF